MTTLHAINTTIHILAATFALLIGMVSLVSVKGGRVHRRAGKYFLPAAILAALAAATGIVIDSSRPALNAITIVAIYELVSGMRALSLGRKQAQSFGVLDAAIAIAGLGCAFWLQQTMGPSVPSFSPALGYAAMGVVTLLACYDLSRFAWQKRWAQRIWPIDHGLKMVGFYTALMSAAAGNLLRDFQPWSQMVPSVAGTLLLIVFTALYFRPRRVLIVDQA